MPKNELSESVRDIVGTATYIPTKSHLVVWSRYFRDEQDAIDNGLVSKERLKDFSFGTYADFLITQIYRIRSYFNQQSDYHIWMEIPYDLIA